LRPKFPHCAAAFPSAPLSPPYFEEFDFRRAVENAAGARRASFVRRAIFERCAARVARRLPLNEASCDFKFLESPKPNDAMPGINDSVSSLLTSFLDVHSLRTQVISGNMANVDTPRYKARAVEFETYMRRLSARIAPELEGPAGALADFDDGAPTVVEKATDVVGMDGNTVDAAQEMASLAEAAMQYQFGLQMLQSRLRAIRLAIREGR
jgi:flagellar basal-body rod protein FlgB